MPIEFKKDIIIKGKTKKKKEVELRFKQGYSYSISKVVYRRNKTIADLYFADNAINPYSYILCDSISSNDFETHGNTHIEICTEEDN